MSSVSASIWVATDPPDAFRAFTTEIDSWWLRTPGARHDASSTMHLDHGVGGRLVEITSEVIIEHGRVTRWEPGRRLSYTDRHGTEVDVIFRAERAGTRIELEQRGLERLDAADADHVRRFGAFLLLRWFADHSGRRPAAQLAPTTMKADQR